MEKMLNFSLSPLSLLLCCVISLCFVSVVALSRDDFPPGFIFGAGASAYQVHEATYPGMLKGHIKWILLGSKGEQMYQVEGAAAEDGRKPSFWDPYCHAGYEIDHSNGDVAADQYHKYKEDIKLMHETGLDAYRFSIAWPRLIPDGRGEVNAKGLQYYNNFIDELLSYGIQPHITLYHFDLPLALQEKYNGLLSPQFIDDFTAYADVCFKEFGDRVKYWVTVNEPNIEPIGGYDRGILPPQRCSYPYGVNCTGSNSTVEPYIVAHHLLLAHASAANLYKEKYQEKQGGKIGITLLGWWYEPATETSEDIAAARRMVDFHIGWIMHPLVYGNYPPIMRKNAGSRLPSLSEEDSRRVKGSFDFVGFNHYIVVYMQADPSQLENQVRDYMQDTAVKYSLPFATLAKGPLHKANERIPPTPWALQKMLEHIKVSYGNPLVMIHENGNADIATPERRYEDDFRIDFLQQYLEALAVSIRNGSNTQGYFVWSFIDTFEFQFGYTARFGLYGVDFNSEEKTRYQRKSAKWYSKLLGSNGLEKNTTDQVFYE